MIDKLLNSSFVKFLGVGVINTIVGTLVMFCFYNLLHLNYWISSASNYIVGGIISYFLNKHYTFKYTGGGWAVVVRFALNVAICYFIAYGVAKPLLMNILAGYPQNIQENLAMIVGMGLYVMLNYLGQRFFTFRKKA
ncbi:MAG: GtrA family protein [Lachnospiraceae bacterium]|nr:GtrA family protein [Lachnospiraceae bacterium]